MTAALSTAVVTHLRLFSPPPWQPSSLCGLKKTPPRSRDRQRNGKFQVIEHRSPRPPPPHTLLHQPCLQRLPGPSVPPHHHHRLIFHFGETLGDKEHEAGLEGPKVGSPWRPRRLAHRNAEPWVRTGTRRPPAAPPGKGSREARCSCPGP